MLSELKWDIVEKEAFAIFYSLMKLEHLIRDRPFILKTDNKNLIYLNACHREKVKRWKRMNALSFEKKLKK